MSDCALALLLRVLGILMTVGSKFMPGMRSQITKSLTFQLSAGDHVCQHWVFDAPRRRVRSARGRASTPECAVHFRTSAQALRALTSAKTVDRVVAGLHEGSVELHGSAFVLLWFHGLTRKIFKRGRPSGPRYELPDRYLAHDPKACGVESIVIEPAVTRLDPEWTAAWRARSSLLQVRSATDEPVLEP